MLSQISLKIRNVNVHSKKSSVDTRHTYYLDVYKKVRLKINQLRHLLLTKTFQQLKANNDVDIE